MSVQSRLISEGIPTFLAEKLRRVYGPAEVEFQLFLVGEVLCACHAAELGRVCRRMVSTQTFLAAKTAIAQLAREFWSMNQSMVVV